MIITNLLSAAFYIATIALFPEELVVSYMNATFFLAVLFIVAFSWGPLFLIQLVLGYLDPSDYQKIMKNVKRKKINTNLFK
jgi:hypothetical protein